MRTKISKDLKKIPPTSDHKICVSVPKVVLDASDCAKLLDGTGQTSVIVMERNGKMVAVSRSSSSSASSTSESSISSSSSSTSSSLKSPVITSRTSSSESASVKSSQECHDSTTKASSLSSSLSLTSNGKAETADHREIPTTTTSNHAQDSIPLDQGKMILKPPKKRRVNEAGLYEDSSSLMNGDHSGHGGVMASTPSVSLTFVGEAKEAAAIQSTPSLPVMSAASNSLQKHTIENLLQSSPSYNSNNNNNNNNNSSSSSNMNLISGLPYPSHQSYTPTPVIHPPIHQPAGSHDLCSTTTTIPPSILPASSPLSPHQSSAFSSLSSSLTTTTCMVAPNPSHDSSSLLDPNPSIVYNPHHHLLPVSQLPPPVQPHIPVSAPVLSDKEPADDFHHPSSSTPSQPSPTPDAPRPPYRTSPEQDEPINLSTTFSKPGMSNESENLTDDHQLVADNHTTTEGHSQMEMDRHSVQNSSCVSHNDSVVEEQQNSGPSYAGSSNLCASSDKNILVNDSSEVSMNVVKMEKEPSQRITNSVSGISENSSDNLKLETPNCSSTTSVVGNSVENDEEMNNVSCFSQNSQDPSIVEGIESSNVKSSLSSSISPSSKDVSPPPDGSVPPKKPKKSSKKRLEIPMDEESCAMRSTSYSESIDHVIKHFEYVEKPVNDDIELTEEEESILRQQFDEGGSIHSDTTTVGLKEEKMDSVCREDERGDFSSWQEKANSQACEEIPPAKGKSKVSSKGTMKPKKQRIEKLSPIMQNVVEVLSFVTANVGDETFPSESGLLDLEVFLKSLQSKCQKRISLLVGDNDCSEDTLVDTKTSIMVKKAQKTLSDISSFYPSAEDLIDDASKKFESSNSSNNHIKDDTHLGSVDNDKLLNKSKKPAKRKSDTQNALSRLEGENCDSELNSTSNSANNAVPKQKKVKKNASASKVKKSSKSPRTKKSLSKQDTVIGQSNGDCPCPSQAGFKMETSDIGESIASTSGGSDEQMTPVHEPDTKDEGVNTDMDGDAIQDTDDIEDDGKKPVRHYKKRLDFVKCSQCDHQCRGRSALSRHMKKVHLVEADMPYRCHLCTYGCTKMGSLNRHLYTHSVFLCSRCDFRTDERDKLTEHVAERHKDKLDLKLCKVCSRYIKCDRTTIEDHTKNCQGPTPFKCMECSKEFKYASSLRVHFHTHFPDEPKLHKCDLCDYRTNYKANLHKHHKNMHAVKDRQVQCPDCSKMFSSEDNMRRHRKVHTMTRQFSCETCKKSFKTSSSLKGHQLIHTATRPFICNIPCCNRSFRTAKFMKSHQEEFHRLVPKKFVCQVAGCNYSFFKRSHLKRHAITHTGERNYHCAWPGCRKSFRHADNLKVHFRNHSMETLQCPLCDFKYKHPISLAKHNKNVHKVFNPMAVSLSKIVEKAVGVKAGSVTSDEQIETEENVGDEKSKPETDQVKSCNDTSVDHTESSRMLTTEKAVHVKNSPVGPMDLYEFKSEGESEEEGPSPLRWDSVKSAVPATPLPPPPKELLLKNEMLEKKERDKFEKAEKKELLKKEKADKKEQEKKEKAEKKNQEKKEKLEKKEQEKKDKEEKKGQEKREKKELKEKEKKEKEDMKEKERKEKEEQKEKEKKEKEGQKEKERKEKEEQKEKERLKKIEEKEREKTEKLALKEKMKKEMERKKKEVKRLKTEAQRLFQNRSRIGRGVTRKASLLAMKSKSARGKKAILGKRKSPSQSASSRVKEDKKSVKGRKKAVENEKDNRKVPDEKKKRGRASNKSPMNDDKIKPASRSASPRTASPRGAGGSKSPKGEKKSVGKGGKKKTTSSIPRRKPSARIKASQKPQPKASKKGSIKSKKTVKGVIKKAVGKVGKRGRRPVSKKEAEIEEVDAEGEEVNDKKDDGKNDVEEVDEKVDISDEKTDEVSDDVKEESAENQQIEKTLIEDNAKLLPKPPSPSPSSSEEDMLQGKGSPYRDFSDAEDLDKEQEEEEIAEKTLPQPGSSESYHDDEKPQTPSESPKKVSDNEEDAPCSGKTEEDIIQDNDDDDDDHVETYHEEDSSDDDEGINDIPLTPPRAPAPPPVESSEDELELPDDAMDSSAPYSTPAPNTPYSTPAPNTPFSVPGPNTPFSVPPPTNLMQQHSVHSSEEMGTGGIPSVASLDLPSAGSVEMQQPQGSVESTHPIGSVEMQHRNSSEMSHHSNSVEMIHHRNSTEMPQHGSVEMQHPHSVEMHPHSVEMHPHSVEMHPHSVEMHPHSVEMHPHASVEMHPHASVEMHAAHRNSTEMQQQHPHAPVDLPNHELMSLHHSVPASEMHGGHVGVDGLHQHHDVTASMVHAHSTSLDGRNPTHHAAEELPHPIPQALSQAELSTVPTPPSHHLDKFMHAPGVLEDSEGNASSEADKRCFDQYLRNLSAANNQAAAARNGGNLLVGSPEASRDVVAKSPSNPLQSPVATSVITSMDTAAAPSLYHGQADLRRLEAMVGERQQHPDPLYTARDSMSAALTRQNTATPLLPTNHAAPTPSFEAFPSLNPLHPSTARDNAAASSYLRQQENHLFATPPVTSSFMAEAMFQRQSMTTPFLPPPPPQPTDRNSLASRIPDPTASLRTNNTSSLLRRPSTMPTTADMFAAPTVPQAVPRHPLTNAWSGQEVRPAAHWQNPYFPRQTNMASAAAATNNPFFPAKENYLPGRDFMFDPSTVHRSQTERGMFSTLASSQSQESLQLDRFDLSNFFPSAVTPYGSSSTSLDYPRPTHSATPKPFDDRYRQTAATAGLPDFRGLPTPTSAATDRFSGIPGVNAGFNLYPTNPSMTPYHPQHMTADNMNSAFLTHHPSTAQHAMLERDYAAAAAHRGLYPHQNATAYPFIDERQYSGPSAKLGHGHTAPSTVAAQDRDLMTRTATQDSQMQDTYRSMLYRY